MSTGNGISRHTVIFGGAGFIGSNVAQRALEAGERVLIFDNLARPGVKRNLRWLSDRYGAQLRIQIADIRDAAQVQRAVARAQKVFHLAAQVAVTTSLASPIEDFEVNARGTLNILEAIRARPTPPPLLFTSTNKVYGGLPDLELQNEGSRYVPTDERTRTLGISEERPLDFESPYGCSKGCADQYVLDYARTFGIPAAVFRMSCIYGPRQFGNEDQGWVAHFLIQALARKPITVFGDGRQVRDALFVGDLVDALFLAQANIQKLKGRAFNIGGGPQQTTSLVELLDLIRSLTGRDVDVRYEKWRPGDQRYYVSDIRRFQAATGWEPRVNVAEGVCTLRDWIEDLARVERGPQPEPAAALVQEA